MLCSLLNDWNYFWNKYWNLPFQNWAANELAKQKKWLIIILKDFLKQPLIKQIFGPIFLSFFYFHWLPHKCFFSFLIKAFVNLEKLMRFHWQPFIVYENGENLKMLIKIFCKTLIVSSVILAFLDNHKPKTFFVG